MQKRKLGQGLEVSALSLGAMGYGSLSITHKCLLGFSGGEPFDEIGEA